jgi:hypothetical protein
LPQQKKRIDAGFRDKQIQSLQLVQRLQDAQEHLPQLNPYPLRGCEELSPQFRLSPLS